jgi:hypothetical protein
LCRYRIDIESLCYLICDFFLCRYRRYRFDIDSWSIPLHLLFMLNKNDFFVSISYRHGVTLGFLICDFFLCRYRIDIDSWSIPLQVLVMLNKNDFLFLSISYRYRITIGFLICDFFLCRYRRYRYHVDIDLWSVPYNYWTCWRKMNVDIVSISTNDQFSYLWFLFVSISSISTISCRYGRYRDDINSWSLSLKHNILNDFW